MKEVTLYTDGACSGNPGIGGYGAILIYKNKMKEISGCEFDATNNRMELMAIIQGLKLLKESCKVNIYSDSAYSVDAFNKKWIDNWRKNGWKTSQKKPVANKDLWEELLRLSKIHSLTFIWVKGHADNELNNRCDLLATSAIREAKL